MNSLNEFERIFCLIIVGPTFLIGWVLAVIGLFYSKKLQRYLLSNNPEQWNALRKNNKLFGINYHGRNGSEFFDYVFKTTDDEDKETLRLKLKIRKFIKLGLSLTLIPFSVFLLIRIICIIL